jgi:hypothetical protein
MEDQKIEELRIKLNSRLKELRIQNLKISRDFKNNSNEIESIKQTLKDLEPIR